MPAPKSFPLVRGHAMRVSAVDGCGAPLYGVDNTVATEGFVSVALTNTINEPEEIVVTNANGQTCVRDPGCPQFQGYGVEITFCDVTPCLFSLITGQPVVLDANGDVAGFRMNSGISLCDRGFALEVWMGVPGVACSGAGGAYGYLLLPFILGGVVGDFTIENAAVTFTVTNASTRDGTGWGVGPFEVVEDTVGDPAVLPDPLDADDHLYVVFTTIPPPDPTDGCVPLTPITPFATGATAGTPATLTPGGSQAPTNVPNLIAGVPNVVVASPLTAWTTGQYVQTQVAGPTGQAYWDGAAWVAGTAP